MKCRTTITVETWQQITIRHGNRPVASYCEFCYTRTMLLTPAEAAAASGQSRLEFERLIEAGSLHFVEIGGSHIFVCSNSLDNRSIAADGVRNIKGDS